MGIKSDDTGILSDVFFLSFLIFEGITVMEAESPDICELRKDELNEALEAQGNVELDGLSIKNQRLARLQEYEEGAVSRSDSLAAVIGMGNAYLQRVFEHLGGAVLDELDDHVHTIDELRELGPEIRLMVKLQKALETDIAFQTHEAEQQARLFPRSMKGKRLEPKMAANKRDRLPKRWMSNN